MYETEDDEAEKNKAAGRSLTLKSVCSGTPLSCRSLSCNRSSVSLHTLTAECEEDDRPSSPVQARTSAFCSRMVRHPSSLARLHKAVD